MGRDELKLLVAYSLGKVNVIATCKAAINDMSIYITLNNSDNVYCLRKTECDSHIELIVDEYNYQHNFVIAEFNDCNICLQTLVDEIVDVILIWENQKIDH